MAVIIQNTYFLCQVSDSGGSRISLRGAPSYYLANFHKNCMKTKKIEPTSGVGVSIMYARGGISFRILDTNPLPGHTHP